MRELDRNDPEHGRMEEAANERWGPWCLAVRATGPDGRSVVMRALYDDGLPIVAPTLEEIGRYVSQGWQLIRPTVALIVESALECGVDAKRMGFEILTTSDKLEAEHPGQHFSSFEVTTPEP